MRDVAHYVYTPNKNLGQYGRSLSHCAMQISDGGRGVGFHQCSRKPVSNIDGYDFCKQHHTEVSLALGINTDVVTVKYFAQFYNEKPRLSVVEITAETQHTMTIKNVIHIINDMSLYSGRQNKNSRYTHGMEMFDTQDKALSYLDDEMVKNINELGERRMRLAEELILLREFEK